MVAWGLGGGHHGTFWSDQNVPYFNFGGGDITVRISQNDTEWERQRKTIATYKIGKRQASKT